MQTLQEMGNYDLRSVLRKKNDQAKQTYYLNDGGK